MNKDRHSRREAFSFNSLAVAYGLLFSFVFTGLLAIIAGPLVFYVRGLEERAMFVAVIIGAGGACLGGAVAGRRARSLGWLHGAVAGAGFVLISWLIGLLWVTEASPATVVVLYRLFWGIVIGALGGMLGVNL